MTKETHKNNLILEEEKLLTYLASFEMFRQQSTTTPSDFAEQYPLVETKAILNFACLGLCTSSIW